MISPGIYLGDFVQERSVLLARVTEDDSEGARVRALHFLVGEDAPLSNTNYWVMQLGRIDTGAFRQLAKEVPLTASFAANQVRRFSLLDPGLVSRGDLLTLRMSPRGLPPPLAGASVVIEWGVHASRRAST